MSASKLRGRRYAPPRHLDRPKQWVHTPWLLLGMLFITALLVSSQRFSPQSVDGDPWSPRQDSSFVEPTAILP